MSETKKLISNEVTNSNPSNKNISIINEINNNINNKSFSKSSQLNNQPLIKFKKARIINYFIIELFITVIIISYLYSQIKHSLYIDTLVPIIELDNKDRQKLKNYNIIPEYEAPYYESYTCRNMDPFNSFKERLKIAPIDICRSRKSSHVCYQNYLSDYVAKNGVICKMENVIIDPSKWKSDGYTYLGPVNNKTRGCPILENGFFNMQCHYQNNIKNYSNIYETYFNSWNYTNSSNKNEEEELSPGKVIFFISRNQDSPNLYFGGGGLINALAIMYHFKLKPEDIQIVFLESIRIDNDPYYELYKNIVSRGGTTLHIRDLKKKYHISKAIHIPVNWDNPCFILFKSIPRCLYQSKAFYYLNELINKYINIPNFIEPTNYDNETFYYPKSVTDPNSEKYTKFLTFQWRKAWPRGRTGQGRLIGNGPEMIEKLYEILPKHILIRLVDTASLTMIEQITLMRKTDYYIGVHGAGLFLSVFMPKNSILHEISLKRKTNNLLLMSTLSGHKFFCDIWDAKVEEKDNGTQYVYFHPYSVAIYVLRHMNETKLFNITN